ncbi:uncharacterized protein [Linepithema humile]|uniref:uncharacterized protein isoform X2 n=1 Tax=Linepithema humile TaxID=83485 RepID=UPI00351E9BFA
MEKVPTDSLSARVHPDKMSWTSTVTEEGRLLLQINHDRRYDASASGRQRGTMQQQTYQTSNQRKRSSLIPNNVTSVWSAVCATELGILPQSALKHVNFINYVDFLGTANKNAEKSADSETSDREDVVCESANIFNDSWPFIDPSLIPQTTSRKPVRRRLKRRKWTPRRYRKLKNNANHEIDDASEDLSIKRASSLESDQEDFDLSTQESSPTARLSGNNFSLMQLRTRSSARNENRARLSKSYVPVGKNEVRRTTSRTSSKKIAQIDYSRSGYSKFCSSSRQKREQPQNRAELPEYPDYFMNILPVDNDSDTSEEARKSDYETPRNDAQNRISSAKFAKSNSLPSNTSVENGIVLRGRKKMALKQQKYHLRSNGVYSKISNKRRGRRKKRRGHKLKQKKKYRNATENSSCEESLSESESNLKDSADDVNSSTKIQKRCRCNTRRRRTRSIVCTCKKNLKEAANVIMQEIRAHIHDAKGLTEDVESVQDTISEVTAENKAIQLSKNDHPEELSTSFTIHQNGRKRRKRLNGSSIDYTFDDSSKTAYQSVFHECVDTPTATSSLKINVEEEMWQSDDCDSCDSEINHFWRRSSLIEGCDQEFDSSLLLGRKSDDSASEKSCNDVHETMSGACYKYRETPDIFLMMSENNSTCLDDDMEISNFVKHDETKNVVTYTNKNKTMNGSSSVDPSITKNEKNEKVEKDQKDQKDQKPKVKDQNFEVRKSRKSVKADSESSSMQKRSESKGNDSEIDYDKKEYLTRGKTKALGTKPDKNHIGKLVWGSCSGWWPALIIDASHAGMLASPGKLWVYWLGDAQISSLTERTQIEPFSKRLEQRLSQPPRNNQVSRAIDTTIQMLRQRFETPLTKPYYEWIRRNVNDLEKLDELTFYPYPTKVQQRLDELKEINSTAREKYASKQRKNSHSPLPAKKQVSEKYKEPKSTSWKQIEEERLPLRNQHPGVITWAKIAGHNWWPAMIIDYRDCCLKEPSFGCQWIMWYGDYKVSEIRHLEFLKFHKGLEKLHNYIKNTTKQSYVTGVLQASKDYCSRLGCNTDNWTLDNVFEYFSNTNNIHVPNNELQVSDSNKIYDKYSDEINKRMNEFKAKPDINNDRRNDIKESDALRRVISGEVSVNKLCLKCLEFTKNKMEDHPFFVGSLCKECSDEFKPCMFVFGNDDKCFYCTVCAGSGTLILCDREDCPRVYCTACMKYLVCPKEYDTMLTEDPWDCFLCRDESRQPVDPVLRPRPDWKNKITGMFRTSHVISNEINIAHYQKKKPIRVLSLFDGLGTGLLVLLKLGIDVEVYYVSEIDRDALMVSSAHFGDRITYLGDVRGIDKETIDEIAPIDLLIGGSPCNDLSIVNPARLGLHDRNGTGILFFDYTRIKDLLITANKGRHLFWMFENVASMPTKYRLEMNKCLGQEPYVIDSADFSPQHRLRLYWHNIPFNPYMVLFHKRQDVQDVLTKHCDRHALVKKIRTVTTRSNSLRCGKAELKPIIMKGESDTLWTTELEEIFGFPRHYTDVKNLSATDRQKLIGRSWSVQTIMAILQPLCSYFKCNENETKLCTAQGNIFSSHNNKHF